MSLGKSRWVIPVSDNVNSLRFVPYSMHSRAGACFIVISFAPGALIF